MKMPCVACGWEVNLDHVIFQDYEGPVKCFSCGAMMGIRTAKGIVQSVAPLEDDEVYREESEPLGNPRTNQQGDVRWKASVDREARRVGV